MQFAYEAMRADGTAVTGQIEADDQSAAATKLRDSGQVVMRLDEAGTDAPSSGSPALRLRSNKITTRDRVLLSRQMSMLLESGTPLVPALGAVLDQTEKPAVRAVLARVKTSVEEGATLSGALATEGTLFDPIFRSMIAAGEATATLPAVFGQLCTLAQRQLQARQMVVGALVYPTVLSFMLVVVMAILLFFVVPRFNVLFTNLDSPLPAVTKLLFGASEFIKGGWPFILGGLLALVAAVIGCLRLPGTGAWLDRAVLRLPVIGPLVSRLIFARVIRIWAAMLRSHVPLLDTIRQSRDAVSNTVILKLLTDVEESVSSGGRMGPAIAKARLADPVIASAITTGEENGRLSEATQFVAEWIDDDNTHAVQQVTRLAEPLLLAGMGVVVGFVAMALFIPLFDLATAAG